jgi:hypothetical protein
LVFCSIISVSKANAFDITIKLSCNASVTGSPQFDVYFTATGTETQPIVVYDTRASFTGNIKFDEYKTIESIDVNGMFDGIRQSLTLTPHLYAGNDINMAGWLVRNGDDVNTRYCQAFYSTAYLNGNNLKSTQDELPYSEDHSLPNQDNEYNQAPIAMNCDTAIHTKFDRTYRKKYSNSLITERVTTWPTLTQRWGNAFGGHIAASYVYYVDTFENGRVINRVTGDGLFCVYDDNGAVIGLETSLTD